MDYKGLINMFKILIVEDDSAIREELKLVLENNGYKASLWSVVSNECSLGKIGHSVDLYKLL